MCEEAEEVDDEGELAHDGGELPAAEGPPPIAAKAEQVTASAWPRPWRRGLRPPPPPRPSVGGGTAATIVAADDVNVNLDILVRELAEVCGGRRSCRRGGQQWQLPDVVPRWQLAYRSLTALPATAPSVSLQPCRRREERRGEERRRKRRERKENKKREKCGPYIFSLSLTCKTYRMPRQRNQRKIRSILLGTFFHGL